jgi:hypothetical protein
VFGGRSRLHSGGGKMAYIRGVGSWLLLPYLGSSGSVGDVDTALMDTPTPLRPGKHVAQLSGNVLFYFIPSL